MPGRLKSSEKTLPTASGDGRKWRDMFCIHSHFYGGDLFDALLVLSNVAALVKEIIRAKASVEA